MIHTDREPSKLTHACVWCGEWPPHCDCAPGEARVFNGETEAWARLLKVNGVALLLALRSYSSRDGKCWPGAEALMKRSGLCRAVLFRTIKLAEMYGLLIREEGTVKGRTGRPPNRYRLP